MLTNELILHNGYVEIIVKSDNKKFSYCHKVLIDTEDLVKVGKIRISKTGYAYQAVKKGKTIASLILNIISNKDLYVDHINGKTLDNRKENLRVVTSSENARNRHSFTRNNTGIVGIAYRENKNYKYFRVSWTDNDKKIHAKQFNINKLGKEKAFILAKEYLKEQQLKFGYNCNF